MMNCYFVKRAEGDFSETQRIKAEVGHAELARQAFVKCVREYEVRDGRSFLAALKNLLKELGRVGFTEHPEGWHVTGGKFLSFEKMTLQQIFAKWGSVQQAIAKWVWNLLPANLELYTSQIEQGLVFRANDVKAVMGLVCELLYHPGLKLFYVDTEQGISKLETKVLSCLSK